MIKFQNDYTTAEQSKRLLAAGLPEDSADCYLEDCTYRVKVIPTEKGDTYSSLKRRLGAEMFAPCWSVGRLLEMLHLTLSLEHRLIFWNKMAHCIVKNWAGVFVEFFEQFAKTGICDLSKLYQKPSES